MGRVGVAEPGRQQTQRRCGVGPVGGVRADHLSGGEGVAKVVQGRGWPLPGEARRVTEPLEVGFNGRPLVGLASDGDEEGPVGSWACGPTGRTGLILGQRLHRGGVEWDEPVRAMLVRPDQHGALATVDVWGVQPQDLPDAHAGHRQQGDDVSHRGLDKQRGEHVPAAGDQRVDLVLGIDVRSASIPAGTQRVRRRHPDVHAGGLAVAGQPPDRGKTLTLIGAGEAAIAPRPRDGLRGRERCAYVTTDP